MTQEDNRSARAEVIVRRYMYASAGTGLVPLPWLDMAYLTAVQLKMIDSLARIYETPIQQRLTRSVVTSLTGGVSAVSVGRLLVPGTNLFGIIGSSVVSCASTYAIGRIFIQDFESDGAFLSLDSDSIRAAFEREMEQGKIEVRENFIGVRP